MNEKLSDRMAKWGSHKMRRFLLQSEYEDFYKFVEEVVTLQLRLTNLQLENDNLSGLFDTQKAFYDMALKRLMEAESRLRRASDEFKRVRYSLESCKHCVTIIEALEHLKSAEAALGISGEK